ncbi:hypothetical protein LOK49_LG05G03878 [Camellia lanceoleosa]|uniref:Uncharacterized protein n=1 Tax=Camellia lanceoleosa TaxID=1840588 RepID=A0ACC0HTE1_9ERIC|nr:hypothetical protein LOK49_LG05G03878 [Camellia lanceoleosa]
MAQNRNVVPLRSPWTRSAERKRLEGPSGASSSRLGVKLQGRVLFKQTERVGLIDVVFVHAQYWLCEHTNIVSTTKPIMFPRFLKWNISTLLAKTRCLDLGAVSQFEVFRGKLVSQPFEKVILAGEEFDGEEDVNIDEDQEVGGEYKSNGSDDFCSDSGAGNDVNMGVCGNEVVGGVRVDAKRNVRGSGERRRFEGAGGVVAKGKTCVPVDVVSSPEGDVGGILCATRVKRIGDGKGELETALAELYALRAECGVKDVFKVKEDEMKKVAEENVELRRKIGVLEEQLAEQDVHNVTQAFHMVVDGDTDMAEDDGVRRMERATLDSVGQRGNYLLKNSGNFGGIDEKTSGVVVEVSGHGSDIVEVAGCVRRIQPEEGVESSFVRDLKGKVTKEVMKPDFGYGGVGKMMVGCGKVVDAGRAVMWANSGHGVCVCFVDIKSLVRPSSVRGNVIDAYAVLLMEEQDRIAVGVEFPDKSYVFSSICLCGELGVVSVTDCPQQRHDSEDCAIIVCAVMRQYVHHVDVDRSLQGDNCVILRANMVKDRLVPRVPRLCMVSTISSSAVTQKSSFESTVTSISCRRKEDASFPRTINNRGRFTLRAHSYNSSSQNNTDNNNSNASNYKPPNGTLKKSRREILLEYVKSVQPEFMELFVKRAPQQVVDAMRQTVANMIGTLPPQFFTVTVTTVAENLAQLMYSVLMTGYMFRNAQYRLELQQGLEQVALPEVQDKEDVPDYAPGTQKKVSGEVIRWNNISGPEKIDTVKYIEKSANGQNELLEYLRSLQPQNLKELTSSAGEDFVLAMNTFTKRLLAVTDPGQMKTSATETSAPELAKLLYWLMVVGCSILNIEVRVLIWNEYLALPQSLPSYLQLRAFKHPVNCK